jgi:hypothetical protein
MLILYNLIAKLMVAGLRFVFGIILLLPFLVSCGNKAREVQAGHSQASLESGGTASIEFRTTRHDFGTVIQGEKLSCTFIYKNTGNAPLVILSARADCGCTLPEYSSEPLGPGEEGRLKVVFDTRGFSGLQTKTIQLATNAENPLITLALRALIEK